MNLLDESFASYVNLDTRTDRRERTEKSLAIAGIRAERTRGMLPSEYHGSPERIKAMWDRPQKGAIGCHFSQVSVMERAMLEQKHAFVMEDDLVFCSDFQRRIGMISDFCRTHPWDVIFLGGTFHINPPYWQKQLGRDAELTDHSRMIRTYGAFCTYAYIVNRSSIRPILRQFDLLLPKSIGIDHMFIMIQPKIHAYSFVPGCIKQYDHISDIGVDRHGRPAQTVFSGFSRLGPYWWQDRLEDFDPTTFNWHEARRNT
jgi:GR25 family glycosyltransferase involved in LPS biosynthesis